MKHTTVTTSSAEGIATGMLMQINGETFVVGEIDGNTMQLIKPTRWRRIVWWAQGWWCWLRWRWPLRFAGFWARVWDR